MDIDQRVERNEIEVHLIKGEIKQVLVELKELVMDQRNPFSDSPRSAPLLGLTWMVNSLRVPRSVDKPVRVTSTSTASPGSTRGPVPMSQVACQSAAAIFLSWSLSI